MILEPYRPHSVHHAGSRTIPGFHFTHLDDLERLARAIARRRRVYHRSGHISFHWQVDEVRRRKTLFVRAKLFDEGTTRCW